MAQLEGACLLTQSGRDEWFEDLPGLRVGAARQRPTVEPPRHTSPECWQRYGEVQGFEPHYIELVRDYHQLAVDAYAAQHASREVGGDVPPISVAYALVGLYLALDRRVSGLEVRARISGSVSPTRPGRACSRLSVQGR
jgi:Family of unknown function (DUF5946)